MKRKLIFAIAAFFGCVSTHAQDTTVVQTLTYDSTGRTYYFNFPDGSESYRKIVMQYSMRCKDGLVSTGSNTNLGCGEWDYSCNTSIVDTNINDSVRAFHPDHVISNFSGNTFNYTSQPTYTYYQTTQSAITIDAVNSETVGSIGAGANNTNYPFANTNGEVKTQYLITASELTTAGLSAGDITGLKLNLTSLGDNIDNFRVNLKHTSQTALDPTSPELEGFTNVYYLNTVPSAGVQQYDFNNYFNWDGTSNLLVEFTFDGTPGTSSEVMSHTLANMGISSTGNDYSLEFSGANKVTLNSVPNTISNEVTVSFWSYGANSAFTTNTTVFEGSDASNTRQLNVHLPWSNGRVYWDCGNDGSGYDRIDKAATLSDVEGKWNHWAFTKNAVTGSMKIYLNGALWHSGTGKTKAIDLQSFTIGAADNWVNYYIGKVDEFSIWDVELAQAEIGNYMYQPISASHPNYANLVAYYNFNSGTGSTLVDQVSSHNGTLDNSPLWREKDGNNLNHNFASLTERPNIDIIQGDYDTTLVETDILDSIINPNHLIEEYALNGTDIELTNSYSYYQSGNMPIYNEAGSQIGFVPVAAEGSIDITDLEYFNKIPAKIEIMSFVTPYGINLNLGPEGKTWEFDMTDFTTVLRGNKQLTIGNGGQWQEDMDIRFLFIEGTPPRDVLDLKSVWRPGSGRNYTDIMNDRYFEPRDVPVPADATMYKVRTMVTGHGQEGEFIPRTHFINVNGGTKEVQWQAWKECADNPVYPQGGTWVYDRAGWCPGMATDLLEYEIDPSEITNNSVNLDYGVNSGSGDSRYLVSYQLVSYGDINFANDVALDEIKNPSSNVKYARFNPACQYPSVIIQNSGSNDLTSVTIECQMVGGYVHTQTWTGNLGFLEKEEVVLTIPDNMFVWLGDGSNTFKVELKNPNGAADENLDNNILTSQVLIPDNLTQSDFKIRLRTNNMANHNSWKLLDASGTELYSRVGTSANTTYDDTVQLADGCYTLELTDLGEDGLQWWANSSQGSGYLRFITLSNSLLKNFGSDFGSILRYSFTVGGTLNYEEVEINDFEVSVFPNPAQDHLSIKIDGNLADQTSIKIFDALGKVHQTERVSTGLNSYYYGELDISQLSSGEYFVEIRSGEKK